MAPKILHKTLSDEVADKQLTVGWQSPEVDYRTLILLRNLQGQINDLADRVAALEGP